MSRNIWRGIKTKPTVCSNHKCRAEFEIFKVGRPCSTCGAPVQLAPKWRRSLH